jgi:DNA-binding transcriptional MerR regulator
MPEYRLDDLAREAGTTVRSVRTYQESGLLPHPEMRGRVGWYSDSHLARLKLIARLQDRGYTFAAIGELLHAWEHGRELGEVLGMEEALTTSLVPETASHMTLEELQERFQGQWDDKALARGTEMGLFEFDESTSGYRIPNPTLVESGARSVDFGIPLDQVLDLSQTMRDNLKVVAEACVTMVAERILREVAPDGLPTNEALVEATGVIDSLRSQAQVGVDGWFSRCMDDVIAETVGRVFAQAAESGAVPDA